MDEVIYEEFKGTNQELHLERKIAEKRVYPAINIRRSATRREELLMSEEEIQRVWILRKLLHDMDDIAAIEFILISSKKPKPTTSFSTQCGDSFVSPSRVAKPAAQLASNQLA